MKWITRKKNMYASFRAMSPELILIDIRDRFQVKDLSSLEKIYSIKPGREGSFKDNPYSYTKAAVEFLQEHGWQLVGVSYVGGCKISGYHTYHFTKG